MGRQNALVWAVLLTLNFMVGYDALAQSSQYKRKKSAPKADSQKLNVAPTVESSPATKAPSDEKLDVKGLEEKYWSSQDTDFTVVQNRTYTKAGRFSLAASIGMPTNDSYNTGSLYSLAANYYWNERHGVELNYTSYPLRNTNLVDTFNSSNGALPDMNRDKSSFGVSYNWIPVYAKASLLGSKILYFDFAISPGLAMVNYEQFVYTGNKQDSAMAFTLDFTQQFFLSTNLALRIDFKNRWQPQKVLKFRNQGGGGAATGAELRNEVSNSSFLLFGLTYFF